MAGMGRGEDPAAAERVAGLRGGRRERETKGKMQGIDFVIAWVDGGDPRWQERKAAYTGTGSADEREERYRDWGLTRFWFRGVAQFAPWVRKIHFICDQEPPEWLNLQNEKLVIVRHEDFLPDEYRPCFSSHPIELNMHRIKGLSEQFVYFNDDMFLLAETGEDLFFRHGLPRDTALLNPIPTTDLRGRGEKGRIFTIPLNNCEYLNRDYDFRECMNGQKRKWLSPKYGKSAIRNWILMSWPRFVGFDETHLPQAFLKSSFEEAWEEDREILDETSRHAIRDDRDVNQWLIRERQLAEGKFIPRSGKAGRVFDLDRDHREAAKVIRQQKAKMICLNDGPMETEQFLRVKEEIQTAFSTILPEKSEYEN